MLWFLLLVIIFLFLNLFFFQMQKEFYYKTSYGVIIILILNLFFYYFSDDFLYYLSQYLNNFLIVKDFQDIITIYIKITITLSTLFSCLYLLLIYVYWYKSVSSITANKKYSYFLLIYLLGVVVWIGKQDLFFSNWEIFLVNTQKIFFDIQPDFYVFFETLFLDLYDFFIITMLLFIIYYIFYNKLYILSIQTMYQFRSLFFITLLFYCIYFFSCETLENFIFFILISLFVTESVYLTKLILVELKKVVIKSKYF